MAHYPSENHRLRLVARSIVAVSVAALLVIGILVLDGELSHSPAHDRALATGISRQDPTALNGLDDSGSPIKRHAVGFRPAVIRGRCVDSTGAPLRGVRGALLQSVDDPKASAGVRDAAGLPAELPVMVTADDGVFRLSFDPLDGNRYAVSLIAEKRLEVKSKWVQLAPGEDVDLGDCEILLGCMVQGLVQDTSGKPKQGVKVLFRRGTRGPVQADREFRQRTSFGAWTERDGRFAHAKAFGPGRWSVVVKGEKILGQSSFTVAPGQRSESLVVRIAERLSRETIQGTVVDTQGNPVVRARVYTSGSGQRGSEVRSGPDGSFAVERFPTQKVSNRVTVHVMAVGFEPSVSPALRAWGAKDVKLVMEQGSSLRVTVHAVGAEEPVESFGVRLLQAGKNWDEYSGRDQGLRESGWHERGVAVVEGLRSGDYLVRVEPRGIDWASSEFRRIAIQKGVAVEARFVLSRLGSRRILVVGSDGEPVSGTGVELLESIDELPIKLTTFANRFQGVSFGTMDHAALIDSGQTGRDGRLQLRGPRRGGLVLRVLGPGHIPVVVPGFSVDPALDTFRVKVSLGATLTGRIVPVKLLEQLVAMGGTERHHPRRPGLCFERGRFQVDLEVLPSGSDRWFEIDPDGHFSITGIPPGTWKTRLRWQRANGSAGAERMHLGELIGLREGERRAVDFDLRDRLFTELQATVTVRGKVHRGTVALWTKGQCVATAKTDAAGKCRCFLEPGSYRLRVGKLFAEEEVQLRRGQVSTRHFHVHVTTVRLRVTNSAGTPQAGVRMFLVAAGRAPIGLELAGDDGWLAVELNPGNYDLRVVPKRLHDLKLLKRFYRDNGDSDEELVRQCVFVRRIDAAPVSARQFVIRLPAESGF